MAAQAQARAVNLQREQRRDSCGGRRAWHLQGEQIAVASRQWVTRLT